MLMTQDEGWDPDPKMVTIRIGGEVRTFMTAAPALANDDEWEHLDQDLRALVMGCQAVDPKIRPGLNEVRVQLRKLAARDDEYYRANAMPNWQAERTREILRLINRSIFEP